MNSKLKKITFVIIGTIFLLSFIFNAFNMLLDYPVPLEVVTSIIIGISVYTLIIILRDLELADIKRFKKNGIKLTDPKSIKKYNCNEKFSQLRDSTAIIIGIITTIFSYLLISKWINEAAEISDKIVTANTWGSMISDSLTLMVFGLIIYLYVYEIEDKKVEEEKKKSLFNNKILKKISISSLFNILFRLISILIKPIIVLLSLSVLFIIIKSLLIKEEIVNMSNLLPLLGVVLGGFISYLAQTKHQERIEDRNDKRQKKIEKNKNERDKHYAYNHFLQLDGVHSPLIHGLRHGELNDFIWEKYSHHTRNLLYRNLHLFSSVIVQNVLAMDALNEEIEVTEDDAEGHYTDKLHYLYLEIKSEIIKDYKKDIN